MLGGTLSGSQLARILASYGPETTRMMQALGLTVPKGADSFRVDKLVEFLGSQAHLNILKVHLTPRQWQALAMPRLAAQPVPLRAIWARLRGLGASDAQAIAELEGMLRLGALVLILDRRTAGLNLSREWLSRRLAMQTKAGSFRAVLAMAQETAPPVQPQKAENPTRIKEADVFQLQRAFLLAMQMAGTGQFKLTVYSLPYKNSVEKLAKALHGRAGSGRQPAVAEAEASERAKLVWFAMALAATPVPARRRDSLVRPSEEAKRILTAPAHEQAAGLYKLWLASPFDDFAIIEGLRRSYNAGDQYWVSLDTPESGFSDAPGLDRLRKARAHIVATIARAAPQPGDWIDLASLMAAAYLDDPEFMVPFKQVDTSLLMIDPLPRYYAGFDQNWQQDPYESISGVTDKGRWSQMVRERDWQRVEGGLARAVVTQALLYLGLVDLGLDSRGQPVSFRLTQLGRYVLLNEPWESTEETAVHQKAALIVQPNFELVVPSASSSLPLISQLEAFADRKVLDRAAIYTLTRASVVRGLDAGLQGPSIIRILEEASGNPLPQNVAYSIEDWIRLYERVHLRQEAILLEADSEEQMQAWLADKAIARHLGEQVSPTAALVPRSRLNKLRQAIEKIGQARPEVVDYRKPIGRVLTIREPADIEVSKSQMESYLEYRLSQFADRIEATNETVVYRISSASVQRAIDAGVQGPEIVAFLMQASLKQIPLDTAVRIRGWSGGFGPFLHQTLTAVMVPTGDEWQYLLAIPAIRNLVLSQISARLVLVEPERFPELQAALAERGVTVEAGLADALHPRRMAQGLEQNGEIASIELHCFSPGSPEWRRRWGLASPPVLRLTQPALEEHIARAIATGRNLILMLATEDDRVATIVEPLELNRSGEEVYVIGVCWYCGEEHVIPLQAIEGIVRS